MANDPILIKRYENRRLYDTHSSRYVNLEDIARMVRQGLDVRVIDAKSQRDHTRRVLTQIILEDAKKEEGGPPIDFLRQMITASDRSVRDFLRWYLGQAMVAYRRFQSLLPGRALGEQAFEDIQDQLDSLSKRWNPGRSFTPPWPFGAALSDAETDPLGEDTPEENAPDQDAPDQDAAEIHPAEAQNAQGTSEARTDRAPSTPPTPGGEPGALAEVPTPTDDLAREMADEMAELRRRMEEMEQRFRIGRD